MRSTLITSKSWRKCKRSSSSGTASTTLPLSPQFWRTAKSLPRKATGKDAACGISATPSVNLDALWSAYAPCHSASDTVSLDSNTMPLSPHAMPLSPDGTNNQISALVVQDEESARAAFRKWPWARVDAILKEEEKDMKKCERGTPRQTTPLSR